MVGVSPFKGRLMDEILDAEFNNFLSKMARTNEEQQPKANSYLW
jgi:hypothetical protein